MIKDETLADLSDDASDVWRPYRRRVDFKSVPLRLLLALVSARGDDYCRAGVCASSDTCLDATLCLAERLRQC